MQQTGRKRAARAATAPARLRGSAERCRAGGGPRRQPGSARAAVRPPPATPRGQARSRGAAPRSRSPPGCPFKLGAGGGARGPRVRYGSGRPRSPSPPSRAAEAAPRPPLSARGGRRGGGGGRSAPNGGRRGGARRPPMGARRAAERWLPAGWRGARRRRGARSVNTEVAATPRRAHVVVPVGGRGSLPPCGPFLCSPATVLRYGGAVGTAR